MLDYENKKKGQVLLFLLCVALLKTNMAKTISHFENFLLNRKTGEIIFD